MKTVSLDFDGVIHSYTSKWTVAHHIPDPPVPGAIEMIKEYIDHGFKLVIQTTRAHTHEGIAAIEKYLKDNGLADSYLGRITITDQKLAAVMYIDDRGYHFEGYFPTPKQIEEFKPWNKVTT
jgi:hypothetical protein